MADGGSGSDSCLTFNFIHNPSLSVSENTVFPKISAACLSLFEYPARCLLIPKAERTAKTAIG